MHDYVTKRGESVRSVAGKFHVSPEALRRLNKLKGETLPVGARLRVPVLVGRYRLRAGETVRSLAESLQTDSRLVRKTPDGAALLLFFDEKIF